MPVGTEHRSRTRRDVAVLVVAWGLSAALLLRWLLATPTSRLREQLKLMQFWSLDVCVILGVALATVVVREGFRRLGPRDRLRLGALSILALALTLLLPPRTNRIYYDEQIYQSIGQNLAELKLAQMCNNGTVEYGRLQCWSGEYNKQPYAYPHLLSVAYRLAGVRPSAAFAVNAAAAAVTTSIVFLTVLMLFEDGVAAFFAGLMVMLLPEQLLWAATAAVEPTASLACLAAVAAAAYFIRSRTTAALLLAAVAAAYAVQFRPESVLVLPAVAWLLWPSLGAELRRPRLWWAGLLFVGLIATHIGHMVAVRNEGWGTTDARLSLGYVASNLRVNGLFYLWDERFPVGLTVLAMIGLLSRRLVSLRLGLLGYFGGFFLIDLLFYAGSYNYGADVRYSLMTYPPLAMLGGVGAARLIGMVNHFKPRLPVAVAVAGAIALQFSWHVALVRATSEEAWAARSDVAFARGIAADLPPNSYVLTHNPGMFHLWGVNAGQMSLIAASPVYLNYLTERYAGGVYLHWNFWCNVQDREQREFCRRALETSPARVVREYRERDQRYALYRLGEAASRPSGPAVGHGSP